MFENGILDLSNLDAMNESAEFAPNSYATKDVGNHVPDGKVSIPAGTTMTTQAYEEMLKSFQNSFKEAADFIDALKNVKVVDRDPMEELVESATDKVLMDLFENGAIYEAVDRSDKDAVKEIVADLRSKVMKSLRKNKVSNYEPNKIIRILVGILGTASIGGLGGITVFWSQRLWQIICVCHCEEGNIDGVVKELNETYKNDLGEYKFLAARTLPTLHDLFCTKFNWKNTKQTYFLLVDKKLPSELKKFQKAAEEAIKADDKHDAANDKDDKKSDDKKNMNESTDLYQIYLQKFTESGVLGKPLSQEEFVESVITKLK